MCAFIFCRLGNGEKAIKNLPVEVKLPPSNFSGGSVRIVGVACGSRHSFAWTDAGQAFSFGNNFYAQLGYDFQTADFKEHQVTRLLIPIGTRSTWPRPDIVTVPVVTTLDWILGLVQTAREKPDF